ncbi:hypothetical protein BDFB_001420 [Asbolus verrucosus]|uniref:Uncharacterized protein n=1 Tax=Asbolus verrucosus TaxID=1661398 RepID=A0A482VJI1_ASBVE|nr:hypothetical protein BDFB_001420 [Asbolus verrucosus]
MEEHHMGGTPGLYTSGRSTSSSSSPGVAGSSPALLVVPQPINATKMGGMQNGGPQPRKYQCKMCPQCVTGPQDRNLVIRARLCRARRAADGRDRDGLGGRIISAVPR